MGITKGAANDAVWHTAYGIVPCNMCTVRIIQHDTASTKCQKPGQTTRKYIANLAQNSILKEHYWNIYCPPHLAIPTMNLGTINMNLYKKITLRKFDRS